MNIYVQIFALLIGAIVIALAFHNGYRLKQDVKNNPILYPYGFSFISFLFLLRIVLDSDLQIINFGAAILSIIFTARILYILKSVKSESLVTTEKV